MAQYTKHNSNYIKTNIHQKLKDGSTIFERDWVTIGSQLHFGPGKIPYYTNGNFIFTTSPIPHYQKKYKNGVAVGLWTYDDVKDATNVVNKINNDEYTEDIRTYVYYGSCVELVRSSIEHIISNFPGNITVSDTEINIDNEKYYVLNNPFGIILNEKQAQLTQYDNELHYLSYSWDKYEIKPNDKNKFDGITSYEIDIEPTSSCVKELDMVYKITINKKIVIEAYIYDGEIVPLVKDKGIVIQPKKEVIENYFNNLQGFEKQLLTRKTTPLYSNMFVTPIEYNLGYLYYKRTYTWPSNGYCIDITSTTYIDFLNKLSSMAEIYDELWTDNLWRRMTHEAIKNYDWTYTREFEDGEEQDNIDGGERMHKVLNIIGRVFDDVKRNIDLIKKNNRTTYNGDRNIPNALLSDKLELMGWDAYSTISTYTITETVTDENGNEQTIEREIPASEVKIEDEFLKNYNKKEYKKDSEKPEDMLDKVFKVLPDYISKEEYDGKYKDSKNAYNKYNNISWYETKNNNELTFTDVDVNFMRKMLLSSKYILKTKGTRAAIDMIMAMFGYGLNGEDYSIIETYRKVKPKMYDYSDSAEEDVFGDKIVRLNAYKENERIYPDDEVSGIPVGSFKVQTNIDDICEFTTYLIPYYDQRKMYDGDFTFQSKGGWFYNGEDRWIPNKQYYCGDRVFYDGDIWRCTENNTGQAVFKKEYFEKEKENQFKWTETLSYLHVVSTIKDLLNVNPNSVTNGNIYYVANVNDYIDYTEEDTLKSNFFVLNNDFAPDIFSSWENIDLNDTNDENAERAKYLDSIILNTLGNNPHVGFGGYDKGETYFDYMKRPFKYAIDRNFFSYEDMEEANKILFEIDEKDTEANNSSDKIKIFADQNDIEKIEDIDEKDKKLTKITYINIYENEKGLRESDYNDLNDEEKVKYRKCVEYNKDAVREAKKNIYYLNSKVVYFKNNIDNNHYKKYFKNVIMKYLMQVIPSTTILILQGFEENE